MLNDQGGNYQPLSTNVPLLPEHAHNLASHIKFKKENLSKIQDRQMTFSFPDF
jgi:hypothetical protein